MFYLLIIALNIIFVSLSKSGHKYWLVSVLMLAFTVLCYFSWRVNLENKAQRFIAENTRKDEILTEEKRGYMRRHSQAHNDSRTTSTLLITVFFQVIITFIMQIIGYMKSRNHRKIYKWTLLSFGIFAFAAFILLVLAAIVPTSGFISQNSQSSRFS